MRIFALSGEDILAMQHLTRWHMVRMRRQQSLAEHIGTVALFASKIVQLWGTFTGDEMLRVVDYALTHDAHEVEFGDLPSIMKGFVPEGTEATMEQHFWNRREPAAPEVPAYAQQIVDLADKLEALLFYTLEGSDPSIQQALEASVRRRAAATPSTVEAWVAGLVAAVKAGSFTPQPTKIVSRA